MTSETSGSMSVGHHCWTSQMYWFQVCGTAYCFHFLFRVFETISSLFGTVLSFTNKPINIVVNPQRVKFPITNCSSLRFRCSLPRPVSRTPRRDIKWCLYAEDGSKSHPLSGRNKYITKIRLVGDSPLVEYPLGGCATTLRGEGTRSLGE